MSGPGFEHEEILKMLISFVNIQRAKPEDAAALLIRNGVNNAFVEEALEEYKKRAIGIKGAREPYSMYETGGEDWYLGPQPGDKYWPSLEQILASKNWDNDTILSIDNASTKVLSLITPPYAQRIKTKGLVLGYVQSGKTANYTSVVAKAADVGYKMFVILTGMLESLRYQTLLRMQDELVNPNDEDWFSFTTLDSDLKANMNANPNAFLTDHSDHRILAVVKKNGAVLRNLKNWFSSANEHVLRNCPILIIDDEADQASVNTNKPENSPTAINGLIREIRQMLPQCAYVAYTATPFANVLIDPQSDDLYPSDFIVDLPKPPRGIYFGPEEVFGRDLLELDDPNDVNDGLDVIRTIPDEEAAVLKPSGPGDVDDFWPVLTDTLKESIQYFCLATAARRARGQSNVHSTMLIHTTLYTIAHDRFEKPVNDYIDVLKSGVMANSAQTMQLLKSQWEDEMNRVPAGSVGVQPVSFEELAEYLSDVLEELDVVIENSMSNERLDYTEDRSVYIVIGGNVLSRGLTLEGLVVSFFIRAASTYDTLLQMGRWFGYRPGYSDLPRIWMTSELKGNFRDLATVEQEIRNDIRRYELDHLTPTQFAVRIRRHPALMVTSPMKMRAAVDCNVSYTNSRLQTIRFYHKDADWLKSNLNATSKLLSGAKESAQSSSLDADTGRFLFKDVPVAHILEFLGHYNFHDNNIDLRSDLLVDYVNRQVGSGDLELWNIAVIGQSRNLRGTIVLADSLPEINLLDRSSLSGNDIPVDTADIKAIMSKQDLIADIDNKTEFKGGSTGEFIRNGRDAAGGRPLILIYPISRDSQPAPGKERLRKPLEAVNHVIGIGIVFPDSENDLPIGYVSAPISDDSNAEILDEPPENEEAQ
jgi:hypothetical protein